MDAMCGAEGSAGCTIIVREIGLAAEKTESPACDTSIVHEPTVRMLTMPMLETEHTEPPEMTVDVTGKPLDADASRTKSGSPNS
ncbi:unannotated protein [freshwater metagenome]|uniref:Unannotated protein n=1 Tax=freshwater metagenome TaxID=449393 RepID=A0A6J6K0W0_9ZZZZ